MTRRAILSITEEDLSRMKAALLLQVSVLEKRGTGEAEAQLYRNLLTKLNEDRLLLKPFRHYTPEPFEADPDDIREGMIIGDDLRYK